MMLLTAAVALPIGAGAQNVKIDVAGSVNDSVKTVYVYMNQDFRHPDSVKVVSGKFTVSGEVPENTFISMQGGDQMATIVADGTHADVELFNYDIAGSTENEMFGRLQREILDIQRQAEPLIKQYYKLREDTTAEAKAQAEALSDKINDIYDGIYKEALQYARSHRNYASPAYYLSNYYYNYEYPELQSVLDSTTVYYHHPLMKRVIAQYEALGKRQPGIKFTDMEMQSPDGKTVRLSQWTGRGQYTLVDFWASWCGPCRMEMPNVVAAYKKYHDSKGFEVVGVSFDSKAEAWKKGIADLGMTWPQMSDLKGWDCKAHEVYGVNSIPSNILVDPQGTIIASDLREEGLQQKLKEIFGE